MKNAFWGAVMAICLPAVSIHASSPDSWEPHEKEVASKCLKACKLTKSQIEGKITRFPDEVDFDVLHIQGIYPQAFMEKKPGKAICLFNRKTRKAHIAELTTNEQSG